MFSKGGLEHLGDIPGDLVKDREAIWVAIALPRMCLIGFK